MNNSKKYKRGDLIVTVDYAKGFDYTTIIEGVVKSTNVEYKQIYNLKKFVKNKKFIIGILKRLKIKILK